jgi:hypothetical protein
MRGDEWHVVETNHAITAPVLSMIADVPLNVDNVSSKAAAFAFAISKIFLPSHYQQPILVFS